MSMHLPTFTMTLRRSLAGALVVSTLSACAVVGGGHGQRLVAIERMPGLDEASH